MAKETGADVLGINISTEQVAFAREATKGLGVDIRQQDYRDLSGTYDKVVSVGMFEHVGSKNYRAYMRKVHDVLKNGGPFLLHTIGGNMPTRGAGDAWIKTYIFPHGQIPAASQITKAAEGMFTMEDWHNFGAYYDKTLLAWHRNFEEAWPRFSDRYGERFYRMWRYYLLSCAGAFRARELQLWQIVFSKNPAEGYRAVR
jgi:cyclopropane-fatty-acyl-phospholipid synthase